MNDDRRFTAGILDSTDAARFLGIPRSTFHRWAQGYPRGGPLLHVIPGPAHQAQVTFIAAAEAYVLDALRQAGVRLARIRPALDRLAAEFGKEYVLVAPNLATDGVDVLWDYARSEAGRDLMEGSTGQLVMREIVQDYLSYGEDPQVVADEHGVSIEDVRTAARVLLGRAP